MKTKREALTEAVVAYNKGARLWNELPGSKLTWPEDKFKISYCECTKKHEALPKEYADGTVHTCKGCGLPYKGEWDIGK